MTFLWWITWAVVSLINGQSEHVSIEHMNAWGATLVLCIAIDFLSANSD